MATLPVKSSMKVGELKNDEDALQDSWVDLAPPSRGSTSSATTACTDPAISIDANSSNKGSRHSPKSLHSPNVEIQMSTLEAVKYRLAKEVQKGASCRSTDWIWDWSSRPEAIPPKYNKQYRFRHPGGSMTTPPNSPVDHNARSECSSLNFRHSAVIGSHWFCVESLSVLSIVFMLGVGLGFLVARRD